MDKGVFENEICNRNGCDGVIEVQEKEGCCSCHINAPCSYCTTQTEYCPKCGWSAEEEQHTCMGECYSHNNTDKNSRIHKTSEQLYNELSNEKFGYIRVATGSHSIIHLRGKHNGLSKREIFKRVGCADKYSMARMKMYDDKEFELTYFND